MAIGSMHQKAEKQDNCLAHQCWKLESVEGLPSDVYAIANQKKDPQRRTLYITADDPPTEKSALHLPKEQMQSGQISKTQLWRLFLVDAGSAANMRVQNCMYKSYVMYAPSDSSQAVWLYAWDSSRHENQMYYFGLQ